MILLQIAATLIFSRLVFVSIETFSLGENVTVIMAIGSGLRSPVLSITRSALLGSITAMNAWWQRES